jgi:hypothetical protein
MNPVNSRSAVSLARCLPVAPIVSPARQSLLLWQLTRGSGAGVSHSPLLRSLTLRSCGFPGAASVGLQLIDLLSVINYTSKCALLGMGGCFVHIWCRSSVLYSTLRNRHLHDVVA